MATGRRADKERRFWDPCCNLVISQGVKPTTVRWYVLRAEQFIHAFAGRRLVDLTAEGVADYLTRTGRKPTLLPWRRRQTVDAMQILYSIMSTDWAGELDWDFWRDSARTLEHQHATGIAWTPTAGLFTLYGQFHPLNWPRTQQTSTTSRATTMAPGSTRSVGRPIARTRPSSMTLPRRTSGSANRGMTWWSTSLAKRTA
jgi:hypothetical protein